MIVFLEIEEHAPEILETPLRLVESIDTATQPSEQYYATHCVFAKRLNMFIVILHDGKRKQSSKLELYSFCELGVFNESFMRESIKQAVEVSARKRQSMFSACLTPMCCNDNRQSMSTAPLL